jgi:hypothetical protein
MNYFRFRKKKIIMEYTNLGNTDVRVSKICLGTMTFGEQNTEAEGHEQMDYALDQGLIFSTRLNYTLCLPLPKTMEKQSRSWGVGSKAAEKGIRWY